MKLLRFDSVGGASGDMILAALIDLGAGTKTITAQLKSLNIGHFQIKTSKVADCGISGTQVNVVVPHHHGHTHKHRKLRDIRKLVTKSKLPAPVKTASMAVFERLATVEAAIHNTTPDQIHFHEVGAMDSIIDIVGSCIALNLLGIDEISVGPLPAGCGTIKCAHGILPNPAPATTDLLRGFPVIQTDEPFELVTPTGAALLTTLSTKKKEYGEGFLGKQAYGMGHRKLNSRPNILRAVIIEYGVKTSQNSDSCIVLESNIDDMNPEIIGTLFEKLLASGALDVFTTPIQMKKQRTGIRLSALCQSDRKDAVIDTIFSETTTFGIREYPVSRSILQRRHVVVKTPYGKVRVKIGSWKGKDITFSPENSDCVACAKASNIPVRKVYEAASAALT